MARECPECRRINHERRARCGACGCPLPREKRPQSWEAVIAPYMAIAVLIGLIAAGVLYLLGARRG
jgi:hypothetical protein